MKEGKKEWENIFTNFQDEITRLLLQKAYLNDPFPPEIILHKTRKAESFEHQEIAVFTMDQFIKLSRDYSPFTYSGSVQKVCWEFYAHNIESLYRKNGMSCTPLN